MMPACAIDGNDGLLLDSRRSPALELRHLRYFTAVAEDLSVTRAASRLNIAQPALSHQIKSLEEEIGTPLLHRLSRGVALTEPGELFAEDARAILAAVETAKTRARRAAAGELGLIRIGFTGSASFHPFVTGAIRDYRAAYPDVEVELVEEPTASLLAGFKAGRLDVAFLRPVPGEVDHLWSRHLFDEPMVAAIPAAHPFAGADAIPLSDLAEEAFIFYPRRNGRALYDAIMLACEAAGFTPRVAQDAPQLTSVVNLVATGIAISIVPASMGRLATGDVRYIPLADRPPQAPMVLVRAETPGTPLADAFIKLTLAQL
jgi:DNA-binding transcriptional LysR family regulator